MIIIYSLNYIFFKTVLNCFFNSEHNIHKLSSYINTYLFSIHVIFKILLMTFYNNNLQYDNNYFLLLDMFRDYFIYDIINMTLFSNFKRNIPFYIHHCLFLVCYFLCYDTLFYLRFHLTKIFFCEITQIFLINCWILHTFTNYHSLLKLNGIFLLITFFIFRIINFLYHTFLSFYILPESLFFCSYLIIILSLLNLYWFYLLTKLFLTV